MDNIEKLIKDHAEELNTLLPPEGHLERFEMKMSGKTKHHSGYWIGFLSGIAAILVVGFFFFINTNKPDNKQMTLSNLSSQYAEAEFFYSNEINHKISELNTTSAKLGNDKATIEQIKKELEEYDKEFLKISSELHASPNDERVISAMISYYQTKLEIINRILNELEKEQSKSENHENTSI